MKSMIQEILTYIIIAFAFAYTIYNFVIFLIPKKNYANGHACSGGCSGCEFKTKVKPEIKISQYN